MEVVKSVGVKVIGIATKGRHNVGVVCISSGNRYSETGGRGEGWERANQVSFMFL